jgi:hypothetical protein
LRSSAIFSGVTAFSSSPIAAPVVSSASAAHQTSLQVECLTSPANPPCEVSSDNLFFVSQGARVVPVYDLPAPSKTKATTDGRVVVSQQEALGSLLVSKARRCCRRSRCCPLPLCLKVCACSGKHSEVKKLLEAGLDWDWSDDDG